MYSFPVATLCIENRTVGEIGVGDIARQMNAKSHRTPNDCRCANPDGRIVIDDPAFVIVPRQKIKRPRVALPEVKLEGRGTKFRRMTAMAEALAPIVTAAVDPVDANSLGGAVVASQADLITPVLTGSAHRLRVIAEGSGLDLSPARLVPTGHLDAVAPLPVQMARKGEVRANEGSPAY